MRNLLIALAFICGCSSEPDPYTWGDVSTEIADGFCAALVSCGSRIDVEMCAGHTRYHLCELDSTCDLEMADGAQETVEACTTAMLALDATEIGCYLLQAYGAPPEECAPVLGLKPSPTP